MKRLIIVAAAVAVLGFAALAVGGAVTSAQEGDGPIGTFLSKLADKLGVGEDQLKDAIKDTQLEMIDEAVAEGRITEEQAERLRERVEEGGILFPPGPRHDGPRMRLLPRLIGDAALEVLDMDKEELMEARQDGQSLLQIAEGQDMSAEKFTAALLEEVQTRLDALVEEGKLTQEQAEKIFQGIEENIDRIVNAVPGECGPCPPGHGPQPPGPSGHGPGGFGGPQQGPDGFRAPWQGPFDDGPGTLEPSGVIS